MKMTSEFLEDHQNYENTDHVLQQPNENKLKFKKNIEDELEIYGYKRSRFRTVATWTFYFLTLGLLRIFYYWFSQLHLYSTHRKCSLQNAEKVLIIDNYMGKYKSYFVKNVTTISVSEMPKNLQTENPNPKLNVILEVGIESIIHEFIEMRVFWYKKNCYVWEPFKKKFYKLIGFEKNFSYAQLHKLNTGITFSEQFLRRLSYGPNIIETPLQSILELIGIELLNPFYLFQLFAIIVWLCEFYYETLFGVIGLSMFVVTVSVIQTRMNQKKLHSTVHSTMEVKVLRKNSANFENNNNGENIEIISSSDLVPGDIIILEEGSEMQCDCVLLSGGTCIVNESMLTGESVPVTKMALPVSLKLIYNVQTDNHHTLYSGTNVIQIRHHGNGPVKALVVRTGFYTAKGQLVCSILYPPPTDYKFEQDGRKFIGILFVISSFGAIYTILLKIHQHIALFESVIKGLDLYTILVSPIIPAILTFGRMFAMRRLRLENIFCINSRVVNVTGTINCICFDKTGTLTEDGMDMWGVIPVKSKDVENVKFEEPIRMPISKELNYLESCLLQGMVSCHSVTVIKGKIVGDPLDVKMFESTGWKIVENQYEKAEEQPNTYAPMIVQSPDNNFQIGIVHQYQFSSSLQRMSVITKTLNSNDDNYMIFCKGSPEKIISLSKPDTVPENIFATLKIYTQKGFRVIAMGRRILTEVSKEKITNFERDEIEVDLEFLGLVILENRVKKDTPGVIQELKNADMKIVMISGDNMLTALSVAVECGIIDDISQIVNVTAFKNDDNDEYTLSFTPSMANQRSYTHNITAEFPKNIEINSKQMYYAVQGDSWSIIREKFSDQLPQIAKHGAVFGRMSADQKQQLIVELKTLGYFVSMCGDGANDCGALRTAHAGISLSEAESSVASPFTSKEPNISCVPKIIREGRAALTTSFSIFKFIIGASLIEFTSCLLLFLINSNITDSQFLYMQVFIISPFSFLYGFTKTSKDKLVNVPPNLSILNLEPLMSLFLQVLNNLFFQACAMYVIRQLPGYHPFDVSKFKGCFENFALFTLQLFQYCIIAVIFAKGKPYRRPFYTNILFMIFFGFTFISAIYITTYPANWIIVYLNLKMPSKNIQEAIFILAVLNLILSCIFEQIIVARLIGNSKRKSFEKKRKMFDDSYEFMVSSKIQRH